MSVKSFKDLVVWQKADQLANAVFDLSPRMPSDQRFVLTAQMQRAALSIAANIVEGFGRRLPRDKARFYNIAEASAAELQYFLMFAAKRDMVAVEDLIGRLIDEVQKMLRRLTDLTLEAAPPRRS